MFIKVLDDYDESNVLVSASRVYYDPEECCMFVEATCGTFLIPNIELCDYQYYSDHLFETGSLDLALRGIRGSWDED